LHQTGPGFTLITWSLGYFYFRRRAMLRSLNCQNKRLKPQNEKCFRFLVSLPDCVISLLKSLEGDPDGRIIVRCHSCKNGNFSEIKFISGKLVFNALKDHPDLGKPIEFEDDKTFSEISLTTESVNVQKNQ
jgi:hypothetical protein